MTERLYLEDLQVGQRFACGHHALDAEQIKAFARAFDPQPFHLDEAAARGTFFGGLAARPPKNVPFAASSSRWKGCGSNARAKALICAASSA